MQIRCSTCTRTIAIAPTGALPPACPHCAGAAVPARLGPYVPLRLVATGGMGEVYLARHAELGTEVALKLLPAMPLDAAAAVRERFAREARLTAAVPHEGVVKVLASDMAGDRPYLVLEFVAGQTLRQRLQDGPLPVEQAARCAAEVAGVLAAAHAHGVLHRDVKPDNVMLGLDGRVRVLDFGIARAMADDAPLTRTGEILGTPEYMAPEQLLDGPEAIDERTDVHALGVLLYELLTQRSPFHGSNLFQALKLVESLVPQPPSALRPGVPAALDAVVLRALQKDPAARFGSAAAFAAAVRTAVPNLAIADRGSLPVLAYALFAAAAGLLVLGLSLAMVPRALDAAWRQGMPGLDEFRQTLHAQLAPLRDLGEAERLLQDGHWTAALALAERAHAGGAAEAQAAAQDAFLLAHFAWPLVAGLPRWLGTCDEAQRRRLFGSGSEPADAAAAWAAALAGGDDVAAGNLLRAAGTAEGPLADLLRCRALPPDARAAAVAAHAQRLPLDEPEHWLARLIERHLRGDPRGATQAAEMAWLAGGGELAVLLDAGLQTLAIEPAGPRFVPLPGPRLAALQRRLAAADADDAPAGALLWVLLAAVHGGPQAADLPVARSFPALGRAGAGDFCVAAATAAPAHGPALLQLAAALGVQPAHDRAPWNTLPAAWRAAIDAEAARGR